MKSSFPQLTQQNPSLYPQNQNNQNQNSNLNLNEGRRMNNLINMNHNLDTIDTTLLSRISRQICLIGYIFYIILMFPSFFHAIEKLNNPMIINEDIISSNSRLIIGSLCGFYFASVAWNLSKLLTFKYLKRASTNGITRLNLFIGIIASTSSLYTTIFGWGGMKEDYFGYLSSFFSSFAFFSICLYFVLLFIEKSIIFLFFV